METRKSLKEHQCLANTWWAMAINGSVYWTWKQRAKCGSHYLKTSLWMLLLQCMDFKHSYAHKKRLLLLVLPCSVCHVLILLAQTATQPGYSCRPLALVSWHIQIRGRPEQRTWTGDLASLHGARVTGGLDLSTLSLLVLVISKHKYLKFKCTF